MSIEPIIPQNIYNRNNNFFINKGKYTPAKSAVENPQYLQEKIPTQQTPFLQEASKLPTVDKITLLEENEDYLNILNGIQDIVSTEKTSEHPCAFNLASARKMSPEYSPSIVNADFRTQTDFSERFPEGVCC